jgi:hypothetical protein
LNITTNYFAFHQDTCWLSLTWGSICNCSHFLLVKEWIWLSVFFCHSSFSYSLIFFLLMSWKKWDGIYTTETYTQQLKQESNGWLVYATRNDDEKRKSFFSLVKMVKREKKRRERKRLICFIKRKTWEVMKQDQIETICLLSNVWTNTLVCLFLLVIDRSHWQMYEHLLFIVLLCLTSNLIILLSLLFFPQNQIKQKSNYLSFLCYRMCFNGNNFKYNILLVY